MSSITPTDSQLPKTQIAQPFPETPASRLVTASRLQSWEEQLVDERRVDSQRMPSHETAPILTAEMVPQIHQQIGRSHTGGHAARAGSPQGSDLGPFIDDADFAAAFTLSLPNPPISDRTDAGTIDLFLEVEENIMDCRMRTFARTHTREETQTLGAEWSRQIVRQADSFRANGFVTSVAVAWKPDVWRYVPRDGTAWDDPTASRSSACEEPLERPMDTSSSASSP